MSPEQAAEQLIGTPCMGRRGLLPKAVLHRPDAYIAMDNFYTLTVYEKGAEVVRICERPSYPSSPCDSSRDIPDGFCGYCAKYENCVLYDCLEVKDSGDASLRLNDTDAM